MNKTQLESKLTEAKKHFPLPTVWMEIIETLMNESDTAGILYEVDDWVWLHDGRIRQITYFDEIGWARGDDFEVPVTKIIRKATETEVKQHQEFLRWDKIGRLPGEYKEGDIVKHESQTFFAVVISVQHTSINDFNGHLRVESQTLRIAADANRRSEIECENFQLTLIAPYKARFDHGQTGERK